MTPSDVTGENLDELAKLAAQRSRSPESYELPPPEPGPSLATALEEIAKALHLAAGFDNQSTTSVAYCAESRVLYLTHQANVNYLECLARRSERVSMALLLLLREDARLVQAKARDRQHAQFHMTGVLRDTIAGCVKAHRGPVLEFLRRIEYFKVVFDADICIRAEFQSNFHGEGRLIRHFMLLMLLRRPLVLCQAVELFRSKNAKGGIALLEKVFAESHRGTLTFASSQGACQHGCKPYMELLGIAYGSVQHLDKARPGWRHPITLGTRESGYAYNSETSLVTYWAMLTWLRIQHDPMGLRDGSHLWQRRWSPEAYEEEARLRAATVVAVDGARGREFQGYRITDQQLARLVELGLVTTGTAPNGDCMYGSVGETAELGASVLDLREQSAKAASEGGASAEVVWHFNEAFDYNGPSADQAFHWLARRYQLCIIQISPNGTEMILATHPHPVKTIRVVYVNQGTPHYYGTRSA